MRKLYLANGNEEFKFADTTTEISLNAFDDGGLASLTADAKVRIKNDSGYLLEVSASIMNNQAVITSGQLAQLPAGNYLLELWDTVDGGTAIYPSDGFLRLQINENVTGFSAKLVSSITVDDFIQQFSDLSQQINKEISDAVVNAQHVPEVFANSADLKNVYPNGKDGLFVTADTGHRWLFVNGNWKDAGTYQVTSWFDDDGYGYNNTSAVQALKSRTSGFFRDSTPSLDWIVSGLDGVKGTTYPYDRRAISNLIYVPEDRNWSVTVTPAEGKKISCLLYSDGGKIEDTDWANKTTTYKNTGKVNAIRFRYAKNDDGPISDAPSFASDLQIDWTAEKVSKQIEKSTYTQVVTFRNRNSAINVSSMQDQQAITTIPKGHTVYVKANAEYAKKAQLFLRTTSDLTAPGFEEQPFSVDVGNWYSFKTTIDANVLGLYTEAVPNGGVEDVEVVIVDVSKSWVSAEVDKLSNKIAEVPSRVEDTNLVSSSDIAGRVANKILNNSGDCFIFFSDPHILGRDSSNFPQDFGKLFDTLRQVYNVTPATAVLNGGDWLTDSLSKSDAKIRLSRIAKSMSRITNKPISVLGNHDTNYQKWNGSATVASDQVLSRQEIEATLFEGRKTYQETMLANTRLYSLDTDIDWNISVGEYTRNMNAYKWEELYWLAQRLIDNNDQHSAIFMHIWSDWSDDFSHLPPMTQQVSNLIGAYNSRGTIDLNGQQFNFANCTGRIEFVLAGHTHSDGATTVAGNVPVIIITNDGYNSLFNRFDVVVVDYDNRLINCVRYGAGSDRTFSLDTGLQL